MIENISIRRADKSDLSAIVNILNHYIIETAATFDTEPYTIDTRTPWFDSFTDNGPYQCFVAEHEGKVLGYANSGVFKAKRAYDTSVEVSIYCKVNSNISGLGTALYKELYAALSSLDLHRAYAYITLPNEPSIGLHKKFGFTEVGELTDAGRKFGRYYSVMLMEKKLERRILKQ